MGFVVLINLIIEHSEESMIIKCWTLMFGRKLKKTNRMLFSGRMKLFLTVYAVSVLISMKNFQIHALQHMVQHVAQEDHLN